MISSLRRAPLAMGAFLAFLILCPLASIFWKALFPEGSFDLSATAAALLAEGNLAMIGNSLLLGFLVVLLSSALSFPLAYLLARTPLGESRLLSLAFLIPFMTPPYIASMGWILFMQKRGLLAQLSGLFPEGVTPFFTLAGLVLVMSLHVFPFLVTILRNAMENIPASLEESAAMLGAGFWRRTRKIFLPLLAGNYAIGALLVFVKTLSEYGTPYTLGRRIGFDVFTTDIHRYATVAPVSFGSAAVLASVLTTVCLLLWYIQNTITRRASYRLVSGKGSRPARTALSRAGNFLAWAYILFILLLSIGVPYFSVIATSLIRLRGYGLATGNFTLAHYAELFTENEYALSAIGNSLFLGLTAATICALLGTAVALLVKHSGKRAGQALEAAALLPEMLPGIVLVLGIMLFWNAIYGFLPLYNTLGILVLTYVVLFLPYTVQYVTSSLTQIGASLTEAARVFGGSPLYIFRRVTFPLLLRGIAAGWMMTFIISVRELVAPSLIAPPDTLTISTYIMREFEQGSVSSGMAMAVLCVLLTVGMLMVVDRKRK